jgi:hypothetical protein
MNYMKRMVIPAAVLLLIAGGATAQSTGGNSSGSTGQSSSTTRTTSKKDKKAKKANTVDLNDRKMYKGKDGQRATPTGHEATGTNSESYQSLKKDSTNAKQSAKKEEE